MNIGLKIKQLRLESNLTQEELAQAAGTTKQTIHKYETGIITNIPASKIKLIADKLDTTPAFLMGWTNEQRENLPSPNITEDFTTFPIIGDIAAGYDHTAIEDWSGDVIDIPNAYLKGRDSSDFFVLRVSGDSMFPTYQNGDLVLILKQTTANYSGQVAAIMYEDNATLKKVEYITGEDWLRMVPINTSFPPKTLNGDDLQYCRVLGIPKLLIREIEG